MREILFRGKRNKEWIFSDSLMQTNYSGKFLWLNGFWYEVEPDTLGQCTGIKDKNGVKIFEGDLCRVSRGKDIETGVVSYDDRNCVYVTKYNNRYCNTLFDIIMTVNKNVWLEVIGNIWDDPGLCEKENL